MIGTTGIPVADFALDAAIVGVLFLVASIVRARSRLIQRLLIPASLLAGFIGFGLGPAVADSIPFDTDRMAIYVYHLLALTFIVVGLRRPEARAGVAAFHIGFVKTVTVIVQGLLGLAILYAFHLLVDRSLSPAIGMLLPLGFGMGPGVALSVGSAWEQYGVQGAADAGLAIAASGFLFAYIVGVWAVNRGVRDGLVRVLPVADAERQRANTSNDADADRRRGRAAVGRIAGYVGTLIVCVAVVYGLTYALMFALTGLLGKVGMSAEVPVLWSLNFVWANLVAMAFRSTASSIGITGFFAHRWHDRTVAVLADILVATAVMAIGLTLAPAYLVPLLLTCVSGAAITYVVVHRSVRWVFKDHVFARFAGLYGEQTGTVSSGLALIRIVDPGFTTPVAQDQVLGSGAALILGFPLLLLINLPLVRFGGSALGYAVVALLLSVYLAGTLVAWWFVRRRFAR